MDEGLLVAAKHLLLGESLEEEKVAMQAWQFVKEFRNKQVERETAAHAQWSARVMMMEQHVLF